MEASYVELAEKLAGSGIKVAKFRANGEQKPFLQAELQLQSFPTELLATSHTRCSMLCLYQTIGNELHYAGEISDRLSGSPRHRSSGYNLTYGMKTS